MQSTGQTSMQASQPVQLSARTTASSLGSFLRALPTPFAMTDNLERKGAQSSSILACQPGKTRLLLDTSAMALDALIGLGSRRFRCQQPARDGLAGLRYIRDDGAGSVEE